jgi:hypothetical protein
MTLDQLLGLDPDSQPAAADSPSGQPAEDPGDAAREAARRALFPEPGDLTDPAIRPPGPAVPGPLATPGDLCDAQIVPIVTGHADHQLLDQLTAQLFAGTHGPITPSRLRDLLLSHAVALLSSPDGLASRLRTGRLAGPAGSISLPLDTGTATETIPPHVRRAVILRDKHCGYPGCFVPPAACQVHHLVPRSKGGTTSVTNCGLFCAFHHLIVIHQWGWQVRLNPDGTKTATSPDGTRILNSHDPPRAA